MKTITINESIKTIVITEKKNGMAADFTGFIRVSGEYVFKATEFIQMLEYIGEHILGKKVEVKEK